MKRLASLPSIDKLLTESPELLNVYGHQAATESFRAILKKIRHEVLDHDQNIPSITAIQVATEELLLSQHQTNVKRVINLTGTVLHTNLGRAELPECAIDAVIEVAKQYSNLEFDLNEGVRGDRDVFLEQLLQKITGAEAATVVNNNAAAVLLTLNTLAENKEVPVSRGELVEIGGSFRIPEVMQRAGCRLVEIGSTNRTHYKDYAQAINQQTALLMKVHTSNYEILGFTKSIADKDIAELAHSHELPFVNDLGSGTLIDLRDWHLPYEPTVQEALAQGADIVTFSGDKLLGGPQCGIIVGRADLIERIKQNPMKRALRVDKMTIAALGAVLKLYLNPETLAANLPTLGYLTRTVEDLRARAQEIIQALPKSFTNIADVSYQDCQSQIGSGSMPNQHLPSIALKIEPKAQTDKSLLELSTQCRQLPVPIIGRIRNGALYFDLRTLNDATEFLQQLANIKHPMVKQ